ncbi:hypothetical protein KKA89_00875 [Patescibacteria group bacterium]|nr:hypothetical protein [Patescibacteria group bacterium]MBU2416531.1 hypothetical protein [Patescibacteria group bacterium]
MKLLFFIIVLVSFGFIEVNFAVAALPVASSVNINSGAGPITLTEATTTNVVCSSTVTDADGYGDITSVEAKLYRTGVGAGVADDNNNHYTLAGDANCIPSGGSGTTETYTCTFPVQYYADATDAGPYSADHWTCQVTPSDAVGAGTLATTTQEVNSLSALNVTGTIAYGEIALGTNTGTTTQIAIVTNTGNRSIDVQLSSAVDMACTVGVIPVANQKYAAAGFTYGTGDIALSATATTLALTLPQRTDAEITANTYWGLAMPSSGVNGTCSGTNVFTAIAD